LHSSQCCVRYVSEQNVWQSYVDTSAASCGVHCSGAWLDSRADDTDDVEKLTPMVGATAAASAAQKGHARHLHALQWSALNSSAHHDWHCSSATSFAISLVHAQKALRHGDVVGVGGQATEDWVRPRTCGWDARRGAPYHALHLHRPQWSALYAAVQKPAQSANVASPSRPELHVPSASASCACDVDTLLLLLEAEEAHQPQPLHCERGAQTSDAQCGL
jgi:hypothetical protein